MKIVAVLAFLAACYTHSEALECVTVTDWTDATSITTAKETCTTESTCTRPLYKSDKTYEATGDGANKWGCGACSTTDKCVSCDSDNCNTVPIECYTSKDLVDTSKVACPDKDDKTAETHCQRSKIDLDGNYVTDSFKCGEGADTTTTINCKGTLCQELVTTKKQCFDYEKDEDNNNKWTKKAEKKDCYTEAADGCKMPAPTNTENSWESCGKDCTGVGDTTLCSGCDGDSCNDQETAFMCYTGLANAADDAAVKAYPLQFCGSVEKCQRPFFEYGKIKTDSVGYACGVCDEQGNPPCVNCAERACNTYPNTETHKCFTWTFTTKWEAGALKSCHTDSADRKCSMPKGDSPNAGDLPAGGCGPCAADPSNVCTTTDKEENRESTHECYTWKWETDKWTYSEDPAKCYNGDSDAKKKCSLPVDRSKNEGGFADSSVTCAACVTDAKNCLTSDPKENAGKQVIFSLTALALPIFYMML